MAQKENSKRTSKEQTNCYLAFVEAHPELQNNKYDPTRPKRQEELWAELAEQLNSLRGPTRTPAKWKETLVHWKNQVRSRARKAKADRLLTGGGPHSQNGITEMEERALNTLGTVAVEGMSNVITIGMEDEEIIVCDPDTSAVGAEDETVIICDPSNATFYEMDTPSTSRRGTSKKNSDEMFSELMMAIKERKEQERLYREKSLKYLEGLSNAMSSIASAMQNTGREG